MLRSIFAASLMIAVAGLSGCAANGGKGGSSGSSTASFDEMTPTQIAAWSATSKYPTTAASSKRLDVFVVVNQSKNVIKAYNTGGEPIRNAKLWVNKTFVAKIDGIAPSAPVLIKTDRLYDSIGNVFAKQTLEVSAVQLEIDGVLHEVHGPVSE